MLRAAICDLRGFWWFVKHIESLESFIFSRQFIDLVDHSVLFFFSSQKRSGTERTEPNISKYSSRSLPLSLSQRHETRNAAILIEISLNSAPGSILSHKSSEEPPTMFCRSSMATSLRVTSSCFRKLKGNASSGQSPSHRTIRLSGP